MPVTDNEIADLIKKLKEVQAVRVRVLETFHNKIGSQIVRWAVGEEALPGVDANLNVIDVDAFRAAFGDEINLPDHITKIRFVQPQEGEYIIRLPGREQAKQSRTVMAELEAARAEMTDDQFETNKESTNYPIPDFYQRFAETEGEDPKPTQLLNSRVADYTFAMCT